MLHLLLDSAFPCQAFKNNSLEITELADLGRSISDIKDRISITNAGANNRFLSLLRHKYDKIDEICCVLYGVKEDEYKLLRSHKREDRI